MRRELEDATSVSEGFWTPLSILGCQQLGGRLLQRSLCLPVRGLGQCKRVRVEVKRVS